MYQYQELYEKGKTVVIKYDVCMKFNNEKESFFFETDETDVGLEARDVLWFPKDKVTDNTVLSPVVFARKSIPSTDTR